MTYRTTRFPSLSFAWSYVLVAVLLSATLQMACAAERPYILFIVADDLSWSDLGCYGHPYHRTPHLDRLASEGVRFTNAYAPAPICIPDVRVAYAAMVETLDHQVGRVLQSLDDAGIAEKTLLVFISDNGGHPNYSANAPHRGSKWNLYEGGIRVPLIARWPEHIRRGGECDQPVHGCDLPLTFAHFAKADWEANSAIDGISIAPLLLDPQHALPERSLTWHFPYYHPEQGFQEAPSRIGINDFITSQTRPHSAIRLGRYKLLNFDEHGRIELYDLSVDPGETTNLAATHPALAGQLRDRLLSELRASGARFVTR